MRISAQLVSWKVNIWSIEYSRIKRESRTSSGSDKVWDSSFSVFSLQVRIWHIFWRNSRSLSRSWRYFVRLMPIQVHGVRALTLRQGAICQREAASPIMVNWWQ